MSRVTLNLDELVEPFEARVVVEVDAAGAVTEARFDLAGLPRVDSMLAGRPVSGVPALVERLCGICPAAHHLAGVRALDLLAGAAVPPSADAVRRLLHHGSALDAHAMRFALVDRGVALGLRRLAKAAMAVAGSPGHFPATAVPGGVKGLVDAAARDALVPQIAAALDDVGALAERLLAADPGVAGVGAADDFAGADVALVDGAGQLDLLGDRWRALRSGAVVAEGTAWTWATLVAEARPGEAAPRPYLAQLGADEGRYRVGPVAQLRVGALPTPRASELQRRWAETGAGALAARGVLAVHALEAIAELLRRPELVAGATTASGAVPTAGASTVTGLVDGPRGLLAHTYAVDAAGVVTRARILTPTAQNEPWLAELLRASVAVGESGLEDSIREADPCLPCTSAPRGAMGLAVTVIGPDGERREA